MDLVLMTCTLVLRVLNGAWVKDVALAVGVSVMQDTMVSKYLLLIFQVLKESGLCEPDDFSTTNT